MTKDEMFLKIAQKHLNIETLETRKRDRLDFYDVAVWDVRAALEAAFTAGELSAKKYCINNAGRGGEDFVIKCLNGV